MSRTTFSGPVASQNGFISVATTSGKTLTLKAPAALSADTTLTFPNGAGSNNQFLKTDGAGNLSWGAGDGTGTVTSVGGTGTVNGLTLTGTVTSTGNLTLGGTLNLSSPPTIGGGTPAAGTFTNLTSTGNTILGNAPTDTFGVYGVTPVVQPAGTGVTAGFTAGMGTAVLDDSTFTGNTGTAAYTIGDVVKALKDLGLLAA